MVIFFGYPVVHEDSARRAVQTALGILARVEALNRAFQPELGLELGVRLGRRTGTVVVEDVKDEGLRIPMATGEPPNIAARVQAQAPRNGAVLTKGTRRLVAPFFQCEDLGAHRLKGLARPVHWYRLVGESNVATRLEAAAQAGLTPLVGRQNEPAWLRESWRDAAAGHPRWVRLSGEPGIGKSRLIETLGQQLKTTTHQLLVCQCSPYRQNSAFAPVSDLIGRHLELTGPEAPPCACAGWIPGSPRTACPAPRRSPCWRRWGTSRCRKTTHPRAPPGPAPSENARSPHRLAAAPGANACRALGGRRPPLGRPLDAGPARPDSPNPRHAPAPDPPHRPARRVPAGAVQSNRAPAGWSAGSIRPPE